MLRRHSRGCAALARHERQMPNLIACQPQKCPRRLERGESSDKSREGCADKPPSQCRSAEPRPPSGSRRLLLIDSRLQKRFTSHVKSQPETCWKHAKLSTNSKCCWQAPRGRSRDNGLKRLELGSTALPTYHRAQARRREQLLDSQLEHRCRRCLRWTRERGNGISDCAEFHAARGAQPRATK